MGMSSQDLAPPPPNSTFGDTIVASNPFDDTPPSIQHSHQNGAMMNHHMPHSHHPSQFMQPSHYPNAHPMSAHGPVQRNMMNPSMDSPYPMSNQQPPHVPANGPMPPMMHASKLSKKYDS